MAENQDFIEEFGLVARDSKDLLDLPLQFRWEFTRRHPYYLLLWRLARGYRRSEFAADSDERQNGLVAMYLLGLIGVTGEPEDPACAFEELGDVDPAFLSGSVQPMTIRNIICILISQLPRAELECLRAVLDVAIDPEYAVAGDSDATLQKRKASSYLMQVASQLFDSYADAPLYYIHLDSSQRRIVDDVETFIRRWKERRNIPERRTRIQEFPDYLRVWDMREGWTDGSYDMKAGRAFDDIARELHQPKSSVVNAYRAAFKRIIGQDFIKELWLRVMGLIQLPALYSRPDDKLMARYRKLLSANTRRPVPEARLEPEPVAHGQVGLIERESAVEDDQLLLDLAIDLSELIKEGLPDDEIAERLELDDPSVIGHMRSRLTDLDELR
jgi:hypothetical protein